MGEVTLQVPHLPGLSQVLAQIQALFEGVQRLPLSWAPLSMCLELPMDVVHAPRELPEFSGGTVGTLHRPDGGGQEIRLQVRHTPRSWAPLLASRR